MTRNVYIFQPSMSGRPHIETLHCLLETVQSLSARSWGLKLKFTVGDSLICRSRNMAVADALANPAITDLIMLDDDVAWEPGAVLRLLSHPVDVVGGIYPKRMEPLQYPCKRLAGAVPDGNGLLEMRMIPSGFLRMTRPCLEAMVQRHEARAYYDPLVPGKKAWALFMIELAPDEEPNEMGLNEMWGEDFTFCRLWRAMGGKVYADTLLRFQHIGRKLYEGCYAESLEQFVSASPTPTLSAA